ncbi:MAG: WG repeat-containing protein [Muribaculaceae bacterium]|nr:WG repeat-containing protein [Muribaculaceae bacterium]
MNFFKSIFRGFFEEEINKLQRELNLANSRIRENYNTIRNLNLDLKQTQQNLSTLNNRKIELETTNLRLQESIRDKTSQNERLNNMLVSIRQGYSVRIADIEREHQNELDTLKEQIEKLREESALKENKLTEDNAILKHHLENKTIELNDCESKLEDAQIKIQQLEAKLQTTIEDSRHNSDFLAEIIREKEFLESKLESKETEIHMYKADVDELQKKLKEAGNNSHIIRAMQADIRAKQDTISLHENDIQTLNEELSKAKDAKDSLSSELEKLQNDHKELQDKFNHLSDISSSALEKEQKLNKALTEIENLTRQLAQRPTDQDLDDKQKIISELRTQIQKLEEKLKALKKTPEEDKGPVSQIPQQSGPTPGEPQGPFIGKQPAAGGEGIPGRLNPQRKRYRPLKSPYGKKPNPVPEILAEEDFPPVENDNKYFVSQRLIDHVFDVRADVLKDAEEIFKENSVEELSNLQRELLQAIDNNTPYLVCPSCNQMVKIASRRCGWGNSFRKVQYFTHAVRNIPCDLKREPTYSHLEGDFVDNIEDVDIKNFRRLLYNALNRSASQEKGVKDIEEKATIFSKELPFMNRRVADVAATYLDHQLVFEIVRNTTGVRKVYDRDRFYLINKRQVFWIFGFNAIVDYNELRSDVAHDILFTNKRNVFVFDKEAQDASLAQGELVLKCNWLDAEGEWHYQIDKNGKNGELITLDQIHYDPESCRPYKTDADMPYFEAHPYAERPKPVSREKLRQELKELYEFEQKRQKAYQDMETSGTGVTAFFDGQKWGFKYKDMILIGPTFTEAPQFIAGLAKVNKDGRFGVVNHFGEYILNPDYKNLEILPNGAIIYAYENAWKVSGILDAITQFNTNDELETEIISEENNIYKLLIRKNIYRNQLPIEFYFVRDDIFSKNNTTGKWSLLYSKGAKITNITYDSMEFTDNAKIKVTIGRRTQILSLEGVILEEEKYKSLSPLVDGYQLAQTFENTYHLINSEDEKISDEYLQLEKLSDEYLKYYRDSRWGVIRYDGKVITSPEYEAITDFDGNLFTAQLPNPSSPDKPFDGKIDVDGRRIENSISHIGEYEIIESFGQYGAKRNKLQIIPTVYSSLEFWGIDKFIAGKNGKYGIVDDRGIIVLPLEHDGITPLQAGKSNISRNGKIWFINDELQIVEDEVINLQEGYKKIKKEGKWGIVNPQGETIVDFLYDEITTFRGRLIGIINGRLVKLSAYYPYRLRMRGKNVASKEKDLVDVAGIQFQISPRRKNIMPNESVDIVLINWVPTMKFPQVYTYDPKTEQKKVRHIDKPEDFMTGESFIACITSFKRGSGKGKGRIKWVNVNIDEDRISHISLKDFENSDVDVSKLKIGTNLNLTKMGFDEENDRTTWSVSIVTEIV